MKKVVRNVLASAISVALLAGCSDDKKDDPVNPPIHGEEGITGEKGPGGPSAKPGEDGHTGDIGDEGQTCLQAGTCKEGDEDNNNGNEGTAGAYQELYGQNAHTGFMAQILDNAGRSTELDADGAAELNNISVTPIERIEPTSDPVLFSNIAVSEGSATFQLISYTGSGEDLSKLSSNATLQFDLKVNDKVGDDGNVTLRLADESNTEYSMNLTSAINAFGGASTQRVNVPFSCFDGINLSQSVVPFALNSTAVDYDLGTVRVVPESADALNALQCSSDSEVFKGNEVTLWLRSEEDGIEDKPMKRTEAYNGTNIGLDRNGDFFYGGFVPSKPEIDAGKTGETGVVFRHINNGIPKKDFSNFIEDGYLTFDLVLQSKGGYSNVDIEVWFSTAEMTDKDGTFYTPETMSNIHLITDLEIDDVKEVKIPLKEMFTDQNGMIDINKIQNIKNIVIKTSLEELIEEKSPVFHFNTLKLVK